MNKTYIEICSSIKVLEATIEEVNTELFLLKIHDVINIKYLRNKYTELYQEKSRLEAAKYKAYNTERNSSPDNQRIFKEILCEMNNPPFNKPDQTHWGKWELSFIADYIEENFTRTIPNV